MASKLSTLDGERGSLLGVLLTLECFPAGDTRRLFALMDAKLRSRLEETRIHIVANTSNAIMQTGGNITVTRQYGMNYSYVSSA